MTLSLLYFKISDNHTNKGLKMAKRIIGVKGNRIVNENNFTEIIKYFNRVTFDSTDSAARALNQYAFSLNYNRYNSKEYIERTQQKLKDLYEYHIENKSSDETIKYFKSLLESSYKTKPITDKLINELRDYVLALPYKEWVRCRNWISQRRKRSNDLSKGEIKHTIKVSTDIYIKLTSLKMHPNKELTWDQLMEKLIAK